MFSIAHLLRCMVGRPLAEFVLSQHLAEAVSEFSSVGLGSDNALERRRVAKNEWPHHVDQFTHYGSKY